MGNISNEEEYEDENLLSNLVEKNFLKDLLTYRKQNTEMCNMTLLLLIVRKICNKKGFSIKTNTFLEF